MPTKLVIQIPCYNEQEALPVVLGDLPCHIEGIDRIEVLIIDDGSTDDTAGVALRCGIRHLVKFPKHRGLAEAFSAGLDYAIRQGADIIVNTDADNQYKGQDIARLIEPILKGDADIVIGNRNIGQITEFSLTKKCLQRFGSWTVKQLSGLDIPDATTGFRAYSRHAALRLNVFTKFSYTLETIIAAGNKGLRVVNINIETNASCRASRLHRSTTEYLKKQIATLIRVYVMYQPFKFFLSLGFVFFGLGLLMGRHSLILAGIFILLGFQMVVLGLLADLMAANRRINEDILLRLKDVK